MTKPDRNSPDVSRDALLADVRAVRDALLAGNHYEQPRLAEPPMRTRLLNIEDAIRAQGNVWRRHSQRLHAQARLLSILGLVVFAQGAALFALLMGWL